MIQPKEYNTSVRFALEASLTQKMSSVICQNITTVASAVKCLVAANRIPVSTTSDAMSEVTTAVQLLQAFPVS